MKAVIWRGRRDVRVEQIPEPTIHSPNDAIVRITSTALCGSDLHLYEVFAPFLEPGDVLGHEPMGIVEEVGADVNGLAPGDRVVVPFNIACGHCAMCQRGLQTQCETTQVRSQGMGAALFGYTKLYGQVPGGQAEYLRVPFANYGPVKVPAGPPDDRFLYLSDVLPTAWQGIEYADVPDGGSLVVVGLGPVGEMACRVARHRGIRTMGIDVVPERVERARALGVDATTAQGDEAIAFVRDRTDGRGADSVLDAVGLEAHGAPLESAVQKATRLLPDAAEAAVLEHAGIDRLTALHLSIELLRRGGTLSLSGVYVGQLDPMPMLTLFDRQITIRMGQANVRRWYPALLPLVLDDDPLGLESFASHHVALDEAPAMYEAFQKKEDGVFKVVFRP